MAAPVCGGRVIARDEGGSRVDLCIRESGLHVRFYQASPLLEVRIVACTCRPSDDFLPLPVELAPIVDAARGVAKTK